MWSAQSVKIAHRLAEANAVLAGLPSTHTAAEINACLSQINSNFANGLADDCFLRLP